MYVLTNDHNVDTQWTHHDPGKETKLSRSSSTANTNQNLLPSHLSYLLFCLFFMTVLLGQRTDLHRPSCI